jgi:hypothetical protein
MNVLTLYVRATLAPMGIIAALAYALVACHINPNYCPGAPLDNCSLRQDAADSDAAVVTCTDNNSCSGAQPFCDLGSRACRACSAHTECASEVCLPSGACAAEADVAYVNGANSLPQGVDAGACTRSAPCKTLGFTLGTPATIIRLRGVFKESLTIEDKTVELFAEPGTKLTTTVVETILRLTSTTNIGLNGIEFACAGTMVSAIEIPSNNVDVKVNLRNSKISKCGIGVLAASGTMNMSGSTIVTNSQGGIRLEKAAFTIENNFIAENGTLGQSGSAFGGISVSTPSQPATIAHNTIVGNLQAVGNLGGGGIDCNSSLSVPFNIVTNNASSVPQINGCKADSSFSEPTSNLAFGPDKLHLTDQSPSSVKDVPGLNCAGTDIDGQPRPFGAGCDLGADEYHP